MFLLFSAILSIHSRQQKKLLRYLKQIEQLPSPPPTPVGSHLHTTDFKLHSHSVNLTTNKSDKSLVAKKQLPSSAGTQRRTSFDWLNTNNIQRSQSVDKLPLSNVIGLEEGKRPSSRIPSGRTSGLRGLLRSGGCQFKVTNDSHVLEAKR